MTLDLRTYVYTGSIIFAALVLAAASALLWPVEANMPHLLIEETLFVLIVLAQRFPIKFQRQSEATLVTVPVFMAVLLLHPAETIIVTALANVVAQKMQNIPLRGIIFNSGVWGLSAGVAGAIWYATGFTGQEVALTPYPMLAAGAAGLILHLLNVGTVIGMVSIRKGLGFLKPWASTYVYEAIQEGGLLTLGLIGALLVTQAWWGIFLLFIPFVLARYGFERIVNDAAEKAQLAEDLERNLKELKELQAQLVQSAKLASVGTLAAGVAHEINNPIFAIAGRAELLLKNRDKHLASDKAADYVETINEMSGRITQIVRQLLDYSRPTDDRETVTIENSFDGAMGLLSSKLNSKSIEIERDFEVSPTVMGVENQIQQVFVNLIGNAVDATPEWGKLTIGTRIEGEMAVAYVRDTGVGIPKDIQDKLFEPFFTTKEPGKGTGLGLFICHTIISSHGGEIVIDSEPGQGTTMSIKLPLYIPASAGQTMLRTSAVSAPATSTSMAAASGQ